ncbi:protein ASPARTIC PROTEASE IN GUARD CELL 2-like [Panicum miliaceum]|uniref:Protein ASPARTIC PROTEASE IN GUARD CELL 2-like n=1 Tax=Panicum miliaceum TaxID=4540 RepID=A0A3L6S013_PANMI|nr:protein ASPARTIC PROTEASE IN GUARD CELL 2-like [Panicum miliaceum]
MAAASCRPSHGSFCLLLLLVLVAAAADVGAAGSSSHVQLSEESLLPAEGSSCPAPQEQQHGAVTGTRMPVVHQHGPCSPLAGKRGKAPSHTEILAADQRRVEYIHRRVSETTGRVRPKRAAAPVHLQPGAPSKAATPASASSYAKSANLPASSGRALGTGNYVVTIGLGTPSERFTVVFDTGSDTTWVQCQPCVAYCYRQKEPLFSPAKSSTYANISCSSSYCDDLYTSGCDGGHCLYAVQYGDGSLTVGFYAQDTLKLAYDVVKEFRFGCGEKNRGLFGRSAGLMGLGRGKTSLTVQAYAKYGGVFAYCLPATPSGTTGFLDFGPGAPAANARLTPMLTDNGPTFYYVGVTGIKVGGHPLPIPESVFSAAGALVDSGTVITRLPPSAYEPLSSAFAKGMDALGYKKAPAFSILDTCYDLTGYQGSIALPAVSLVFKGGACLDVDASGILYVADVSQACLAFAANEDDADAAIIGNTQQKTYGVLYDLGRKVVGFAPGAC